MLCGRMPVLQNCQKLLMTRIRKYSELRRFDTFEDRFEYLSMRGQPFDRTFGSDRWINQRFYKSREWLQVRDYVILRDNGCDLGILGYEIHRDLMVHHMNPVTADAIKHGDGSIVDPEFLITTSHRTHNAIHYGDASLLPKPVVARTAGDTRLW